MYHFNLFLELKILLNMILVPIKILEVQSAGFSADGM